MRRLQSLQPTLVVVEATGGLEVSLVAALAEAKLPVAVVNPRQVRDFARATGKLAKHVLSLSKGPTAWTPKSSPTLLRQSDLHPIPCLTPKPKYSVPSCPAGVRLLACSPLRRTAFTRRSP